MDDRRASLPGRNIGLRGNAVTEMGCEPLIVGQMPCDMIRVDRPVRPIRGLLNTCATVATESRGQPCGDILVGCHQASRAADADTV